jgi:DNA-binding response OmpR family regulator
VPADVLIVDDDAAIASVLARSLGARGFPVRVSACGEEALRAIAEDRPDVLVLDINLPDITGWELMRRIDPETRAQLPVIVFSASPPSRSRVQELRPEGVLTKPFPIEALVRLIGDVTGHDGPSDAGLEGDVSA